MDLVAVCPVCKSAPEIGVGCCERSDKLRNSSIPTGGKRSKRLFQPPVDKLYKASEIKK